jgi:hypothetical protein
VPESDTRPVTDGALHRSAAPQMGPSTARTHATPARLISPIGRGPVSVLRDRHPNDAIVILHPTVRVVQSTLLQILRSEDGRTASRCCGRSQGVPRVGRRRAISATPEGWRAGASSVANGGRPLSVTEERAVDSCAARVVNLLRQRTPERNVFVRLPDQVIVFGACAMWCFQRPIFRLSTANMRADMVQTAGMKSQIETMCSSHRGRRA